MKKNVLRIVSILTFLLLTPVYSVFAESLTDKIWEGVENAEKFAFDLSDKQNVVLTFEESSADLSRDQAAKLQATVRSTQEDQQLGGIKKVVVAAWSDKAFPMGEAEELSESDVELANKRLETLQQSLQRIGIESVDSYNMAEKANWLQKLVGTDKSELESALKSQNMDDKKLAQIASYIHKEGGPSKAIVMLVVNK